MKDCGTGPEGREIWRSSGSGNDEKRLARSVGIDVRSVSDGKDRATVGNGWNEVTRTLVDIAVAPRKCHDM